MILISASIDLPMSLYKYVYDYDDIVVLSVRPSGSGIVSNSKRLNVSSLLSSA